MSKLKLVADPTFKAKVGIPLAGGEPVDVEMVFKHRTKKQFEEFNNTRGERNDLQSVMQMIIGWELEDEFNESNVELLMENYMGTALAIWKTYVDALIGARVKN